MLKKKIHSPLAEKISIIALRRLNEIFPPLDIKREYTVEQNLNMVYIIQV